MPKQFYLERQLKWFGHLERGENWRITIMILAFHFEGKRRKRGSRKQWMD